MLDSSDRAGWPPSLRRKNEEPPVTYRAIPVERRDIVVSAQASGTVQPDTTVEVKSKASGEILWAASGS